MTHLYANFSNMTEGKGFVLGQETCYQTHELCLLQNTSVPCKANKNTVYTLDAVNFKF